MILLHDGRRAGVALEAAQIGGSARLIRSDGRLRGVTSHDVVPGAWVTRLSRFGLTSDRQTCGRDARAGGARGPPMDTTLGTPLFSGGKMDVAGLLGSVPE